ncbi:8544_t:CDS:2, partial [Cetraspora pellucida]
GDNEPAENYGHQRKCDWKYGDDNWWVVSCWIKKKSRKSTNNFYYLEVDEIDYFFQSPSERQSSNLFKKLRKSDEQDISNEKDDKIKTTKSPFASCVHESQDINENVKSDVKEDTDIDAGQTTMSSSFYQTTDNIGVITNDKNSMNEIHNELETSSNDSNDYNENLDDEEIKFDLANITKELQKEPTVEWKVGSINVTQRFWQYQIEVLKKADKGGLTYENIYEILQSFIISYKFPLPPEISLSLREASFNHFLNKDVFIEGGKSKLNRAVARSFNDLYNNVSKVASPKISENEHCYKFLYPIICPFFSDENEYELLLDRANAGSRKRPDLSCVVDAVPILNSEFKPLGCTPLQRKKDRLKVLLKARKSINQQLESKGDPGEAGIFLNMGDLMESFLMDLKYDGLYRSWSFFTTKLVIDQTTIPLAEASITHMIALENHIGQIAENFKYRSSQFTPSAQMSFVRKLPDSPQIR